MVFKLIKRTMAIELGGIKGCVYLLKSIQNVTFIIKLRKKDKVTSCPIKN